MARHLVLVGGGHAHVALIPHAGALVAAGHRVTLVSPDPVHYYSGMGPGMLGGSYTPQESRFPVAEMCSAHGIGFVPDRVVRIDAPARRLLCASGESLEYDVLSVNTGSSIAPTVAVAPDAGSVVLPVKPIGNLLLAQEFLLGRGGSGASVVVAGGGPAAVEIAGNVRRFLRTVSPAADEQTTIELLTGRQVLPGFPPAVERRVLRALGGQRVAVSQGEYARKIASDGVVTAVRTIDAQLVLLATGIVPSRLFADSDLPVGTDGSLAVNSRLQSLGHHEIFGAGDCIWFTPNPLPRAGVFAVRQTPILAHNLTCAMDGHPERMRRFSPGGGYLLLLNMGDESAVLWRTIAGIPVSLRGRWAWRLKDSIDRAFMNRHGSEAVRMERVTKDGSEH